MGLLVIGHMTNSMMLAASLLVFFAAFPLVKSYMLVQLKRISGSPDPAQPGRFVTAFILLLIIGIGLYRPRAPGPSS